MEARKCGVAVLPGLLTVKPPPDLVRDEMKLLKTAAVEGSVSQAFLAGHIRLLCSLASIKGVDKRHMGNKLIRTLLADFLFPVYFC